MSEQDNENNTRDYKLINLINDTRKFEIDLFWRRANFFWLFTSVAFTGFCLLRQDLLLSILIANVGFFCTFCWTLVNRGSKFWQNSYQIHLSKLDQELDEEYFSGPHPELKPDWWTYRFSPSKLTIICSDILTCMWFVLLIYSYLKINITALQMLLMLDIVVVITIGIVAKGKD